MNYVVLGSLLKESRNEKKISQAEMASLLGVTPQNVSSWERGKSKLDMETYLKICSIYEIDAIRPLEIANNAKYSQFQLSEHERKLVTSYRSQPDMQRSVDRILGIEEEPESEPAPEPETIAKEQETPEDEEEYVEVFSAAMSNPDAKGGYATPGMIKMKKSDVEKLLNAPETKRNF